MSSTTINETRSSLRSSPRTPTQELPATLSEKRGRSVSRGRTTPMPSVAVEGSGGLARSSSPTDPLQRKSLWDQEIAASKPIRRSGRVLSVEGQVVVVLFGNDVPGETVEAELPLEFIGEDVTNGDYVYLTTRTVYGPGRRPTVTAAARVRRLGTWSAEEIAHADRLAEARSELIATLASDE